MIKRYAMKKNKWIMLITAFLLAVLLPVENTAFIRASAEEGDGVRLNEAGQVTLQLQEGGREEISSLQMSLQVDAEDGAKVEFEFAGSNAKIMDFRYHQEEKRLNLYLAGTEDLFEGKGDSLDIGRILVKNGNGDHVAATVSVVQDSVKYVYGTELKTVDSLTLPEPVRVNEAKEEDNGQEEEQEEDDQEEDQDNSQQNEVTPSGSGQPSGSGTTSSSSQPSGSKPSASSQPSSSTPSSSGQPSSSTPSSSGQPSSSSVPGSSGSSQPSGSGDGSGEVNDKTPSGDISVPSSTAPTPSPVPVGNLGSPEDLETEEGINWVMICVCIGVILVVGIAVTAVVLFKKPQNSDGENN